MITLLTSLLILADASEMPVPPMVSVDEATCAPCSAGAQCIAGKCQFTCQTNDECAYGTICAESGVCEPKLRQLPGQPATIRRADATHPERFRFSHTVPPGYHVESEPNFGLIGGGAGLFAGAYLLWGGLGTMLGSPENLIPFIGPIVAFRSSSGWFSGLADFLSVVGIATDVLAQVAGATMIIVGFAAPRRWLERDVVTAPTTPTISFAPTAPGADIGASLVGRF